jgi:hypothetical protein
MKKYLLFVIVITLLLRLNLLSQTAGDYYDKGNA